MGISSQKSSENNASGLVAKRSVFFVTLFVWTPLKKVAAELDLGLNLSS